MIFQKIILIYYADYFYIRIKSFYAFKIFNAVVLLCNFRENWAVPTVSTS